MFLKLLQSGQKVLMSLLCHVKLGHWFHIHKLNVLCQLEAFLLLRLVQVPNCGSILSFRGVGVTHELFPFLQNLSIRNDRRIELDQNGFGIVQHPIISRIRFHPTRVSNEASRDTIECQKLGLWTPKSSTGNHANFVAKTGKEGDFWAWRGSCCC